MDGVYFFLFDVYVVFKPSAAVASTAGLRYDDKTRTNLPGLEVFVGMLASGIFETCSPLEFGS